MINIDLVSLETVCGGQDARAAVHLSLPCGGAFDTFAMGNPGNVPVTVTIGHCVGGKMVDTPPFTMQPDNAPQ